MDVVLSPSPILFDRRGRAPHRRHLGPAQAAPRCGARTRGGGACRCPCVHGRPRCYLHGGAPGSGAPLGNRNAWKHGAYGRAALARRRALRELCRQAAFVLGLAEFQRTGKARHLPKRLPSVEFLEGLRRYNEARRRAPMAGPELVRRKAFLQSMGSFREIAAPAEDGSSGTAEIGPFLQSMGSIHEIAAPAKVAPPATAENQPFLQSKGSFRESAPKRPGQRPRQRSGRRAWPRVHPRWRARPVDPSPDGVLCQPRTEPT